MNRPEELTILKRSLRNYKDNYVLLVPALMLTLSGVLLSYTLVKMRVPNELSIEDTLPAILLTLFVGVLCDVGLATMSAKVITKGTCKLSDWWAGVRIYFWRLLNISILLTLLIAIIGLIPYSLLLLIRVPSMIENLVLTFVVSVLFFLRYVCFAAATIDDEGSWSSIGIGWRTVRASGRVFLSFVAVSFVFSEVRVLESSHSGSTNSALTSSLAGSLTLLGIGYTIIGLFLIPLWFLIAFRIYGTFSQIAKKNQA